MICSCGMRMRVAKTMHGSAGKEPGCRDAGRAIESDFTLIDGSITLSTVRVGQTPLPSETFRTSPRKEPYLAD